MRNTGPLYLEVYAASHEFRTDENPDAAGPEGAHRVLALLLGSGIILHYLNGSTQKARSLCMHTVCPRSLVPCSYLWPIHV